MKQTARIFSLFLATLMTIGCNASVNSSLKVANNEKVSGGLSTVNGSISIGTDAEVGGASQTVNGRISVDDGAQVGALQTVNGAIRLGKKVVVKGDVQTVNGAAACGSGTEVQGDVGTINGSIQLAGAVVDGQVATHNGAITLREQTVVKRDLVIERNRGVGNNKKALEIRILDGSVVEGDVIVHTKREVKILMDKSSEVRGEVKNATLVFVDEEEA